MVRRLAVLALLLTSVNPARAEAVRQDVIAEILVALNGLEQRLDPLDVIYESKAHKTDGSNKTHMTVEWKQQNRKARVTVRLDASIAPQPDQQVKGLAIKETCHYLYDNGTLTTVTEGVSNGEQIHSSSRSNKGLGAAGVMTIRGLCNLMASEMPEKALADFIADENRQGAVTVEREEGLVKLIIPGRDPQSMGAQIWFDPSRAYLPVRRINYYYQGRFDPKKKYSESRIVSTQVVRDSLGSVELPRMVEKRHFIPVGNEQRLLGTSTITFERFVVGKPIDASVLRLTIPAGQRVVDRTTGKLYTADGAGQPDKRYPVQALPSVEIPPDSQQPAGERSWLWMASVCTLAACLALVVYLIRRRRQT